MPVNVRRSRRDSVHFATINHPSLSIRIVDFDSDIPDENVSSYTTQDENSSSSRASAAFLNDIGTFANLTERTILSVVDEYGPTVVAVDASDEEGQGSRSSHNAAH
jgi:hypothetical protein